MLARTSMKVMKLKVPSSLNQMSKIHVRTQDNAPMNIYSLHMWSLKLKPFFGQCTCGDDKRFMGELVCRLFSTMLNMLA